MSFLNRTVIPAANGLVTLSVPLVGGRENKRPLKEVRIDNSQGWQTRHWRTITSAYRRSPWFEFYEHSLEAYYQKPYEFLFQWNLDLLKWTLNALKMEMELKLAFDEPVGYLDSPLQELKPANFQTKLYSERTPVYPQVFQERLGFQPNVSIIDLIFNEGNNSRSLMANALT